MIIAIELDNIISSPLTNYVALTDVEKCDVLPESREALLKIKGYGHSILIYTHRDASLGPATEVWLQRNKIPYDRIVFNKPEYNIVIDPKSYKFDSWQKFLESQKYRLING
jgi:hypothetical protein